MEGKPEMHKELEGLEFKVNQFGEVSTSIPLDHINKFLNENVEDKKLKEKEEKDDNLNPSD